MNKKKTVLGLRDFARSPGLSFLQMHILDEFSIYMDIFYKVNMNIMYKYNIYKKSVMN